MWHRCLCALAVLSLASGMGDPAPAEALPAAPSGSDVPAPADALPAAPSGSDVPADVPRDGGAPDIGEAEEMAVEPMQILQVPVGQQPQAPVQKPKAPASQTPKALVMDKAVVQKQHTMAKEMHSKPEEQRPAKPAAAGGAVPKGEASARPAGSAQKRTLVSKKATTWVWGNEGESCDGACKRSEMVCVGSEIEKVLSDDKMREIAKAAGTLCEPKYKVLRGTFTYTSGGQCVKYDGVGQPDSCEIRDASPVRRVCPCKEQSARGDPHLTNVYGETFDVVRQGINTLLQFPRPQTSDKQETKLRVDASIEHPGGGSKCSGYYILKMWVQGTILDETIEVSTTGWDLGGDGDLEIRVGGQSMRTVAEVAAFVTGGKFNLSLTDERHLMRKSNDLRKKFASLSLRLDGAELAMDWYTGQQRPNSLDFSAKSLKLFGKEWGGILGSDDHSWVSTYDEGCQKSKSYGKVAQFVQLPETEVQSQEDEDAGSRALASLD